MAALVQKCDLADYDSGTGTCAAPYWEPESTVLPTLSIADAREIGLAIALLWATAWIYKQLGRKISQSD